MGGPHHYRGWRRPCGSGLRTGGASDMSAADTEGLRQPAPGSVILSASEESQHFEMKKTLLLLKAGSG